MRLILAIFCLLAGTATGLYRSAELKKRERLLSEVVGLLESMAVQIRYRELPLGDLFGVLSGGAFLQRTIDNSGFTMNNWRSAWNAAADELFTVDGDREILLSIGNALGGSDTAGQIAMLELNRELLQARLREAAEMSARKGAMYRSVGLLTGLGLAVIVI